MRGAFRTVSIAAIALLLTVIQDGAGAAASDFDISLVGSCKAAIDDYVQQYGSLKLVKDPGEA